MSLTTIEYGSLASSETLNQNFSYLDNRISGLAETINASISSILSNFATMNTSFNELSESTENAIQALDTDIQEFEDSVNSNLNNITMLPNWSGITNITLSHGYTAPSNGYILAVPAGSTKGNIAVNNINIAYKYVDSSSDNAAIITNIPVKSGDYIYSSLVFKNIYFLPALELNS